MTDWVKRYFDMGVFGDATEGELMAAMDPHNPIAPPTRESQCRTVLGALNVLRDKGVLPENPDA